MSARTPSASKGAAAAAASANAAVTSAASASAQLSPSHAGSNQHIGAAATAGKRHAGAVQQQASTSASIASSSAAPSPTSSRKRAAAATADGDSSSSVVVAVHSSNHAQSASSGSQTKKQRGESSKSNGAAAAAATSSVGLDALPAPARRPASSASTSSASARSLVRQDECSGQVEEDNGQERKPAAVAAAASKPRPPLPRAPQPHRLFVDAQELLRGALPFAEAQFAGVSVVMDARASLHGPGSAMTLAAVTSLCFVLLWPSYYPQRSPEQHVLRDWFLSVDHLWSQLASCLPQMHLSWLDCDELIGEAMFTGALQAIPALVRRLGHLPSALVGKNPILTEYCIDSGEHRVSLQPYLRLFEFGLDPTEVTEGGEPLSALQLARNFVRDHVPPFAATLSYQFASMQAAVEKVESLSMPVSSTLKRFSNANRMQTRRTSDATHCMHDSCTR